MSLFVVLRMLGSLLIVLALLVAVVWLGRRRGLIGGLTRRLTIVERIGVDARRSLLLLRWDGLEQVILVGPGGVTSLGDWRGPAMPAAAAPPLVAQPEPAALGAPAPPQAAEAGSGFGAQVVSLGRVRAGLVAMAGGRA